MNAVVELVADLTELRRWLRGLWKQQGYSSMSAFAAAVPVAPAAYIGWVERGVRPMRPQLERVAEFVGADPEWALALAGYGPKEPEPESMDGPQERRSARPDDIHPISAELRAQGKAHLEEAVRLFAEADEVERLSRRDEDAASEQHGEGRP